MQEMPTLSYSTIHHRELLRRSGYARLAQAVESQHVSGVNIYRALGQRLLAWGEALQRANTQPDRHLCTGEMPAV